MSPGDRQIFVVKNLEPTKCTRPPNTDFSFVDTILNNRSNSNFVRVDDTILASSQFLIPELSEAGVGGDIPS